MKPFTEKELAELPGKLATLLNQLDDRGKSQAKRDLVRVRIDVLHSRIVRLLSERGAPE